MSSNRRSTVVHMDGLELVAAINFLGEAGHCLCYKNDV